MTCATHPLTPLVQLLLGRSRGAVVEDRWQLEERTAGVHGIRATPTQLMSFVVAVLPEVVVVAR